MSTLQQYAFDTIFTYYPETDVIMPKFTVVINGVISKKDVPMRKGELHGLDMFMHIRQSLAANWDKQSEMLYIKGLYPS